MAGKEIIIAIIASLPGLITAIGTFIYSRRATSRNGSKVTSLRQQILTLENEVDLLRNRIKALEDRLKEADRRNLDLIAENLELRRLVATAKK